MPLLGQSTIGAIKVGSVVIGRNEGDRLRKCITSLQGFDAVVYVDSGSTDDSVAWTRAKGIDVVVLGTDLPFTAARARNAGFQRIREILPNVDYVQFIDGDCALDGYWLQRATTFLEQHPDVGAVCGRRRELFPEQSVYNWMCDQEWDGPTDEVRAFGGDVLIRVTAFERSGGYRSEIIAGEDPELSLRLRSSGWKIWRLKNEMTLHDAAIYRFGQWWQRARRCGYAYALGARLHAHSSERHFVWESRRSWLWGLALPAACISATMIFPNWGWTTLLIYPIQLVRQTIRNPGSFWERLTLAFFQLLSRFPEAFGQIQFLRDRLFGQNTHIIEYK